MESNQKPNHLIHETSPYLLQHAHNPVNWHPWNEKTLSMAMDEDKLVILSIGYSSCHWCHVMEKESFEDEKIARQNASFIKDNLLKDGLLYRTIKEGRPSIPGFLEDYAFIIQGMIRLYKATFEEAWLKIAEDLLYIVIENFYDPNERLFYYSSETSERLIARKKELFDNVIPSSNSVMAQNLLRAGHLMGNSGWIEMATQMATITWDLLNREPDYMSNWGTLYLMLSNPMAEVAITGKKAVTYRQEIDKYYHPNKVVCGTVSGSALPLLENRNPLKDETIIYVCFNKTCKLPVKTSEEAIKQLNSLA